MDATRSVTGCAPYWDERCEERSSNPESKRTRRTENQGRLVALNPPFIWGFGRLGIRSFMTWFSDENAGHLGDGAFQRIVRLGFHLDRLVSKRAKATSKRRCRSLRRSLSRAINRHRERMRFRIDELHWKVARFLVDNFDVILLPTFETKRMSSRATRRIQSKTVRSMLSLAHDRFAQRLEQKAFACGKRMVRVCEAYISKTVSWTGEVIANLGGWNWIERDGVRVNRDSNGAREIFLRALVDSPILFEGAR